MCRSSNKRVKVIVCDWKVNIDSIEHILRQILDYILRHFNIYVAFAIRISLSSITNLNSCRLKRRIGILIWGYQNYVLKPIESLHFTDLIQTALFEFAWWLVRHAKLLETHRFWPRFKEPHACVKNCRVIVHVAQMGRRKRKKVIKFVSMLFKIG